MSLASTTCDPQKQELHFFVVVRDPFDRVLSLYYYIMALRKWPISEIIDPEWVNEWIYDKLTEFQEKAQEPPKDWKAAMLAWIPQSEFVHDGNDTKRVQHILKFENLTSEFQSLMKEYNLPIELSHQKEKSGDVPYADRISKYNLTMDNVLLIQEIYRDDFDLGGYDLLVLTNASMSEDEDASTPMDHATNITIGLEQESTYDNHKQSSDEPV